MMSKLIVIPALIAFLLAWAGAADLAYWHAIVATVVLFAGWLGFGAWHNWFSNADGLGT